MEIETLTFRNHTRVRGRGGGSAKNNAVCHFWKEGKCNRNPCRFLHADIPAPNVYHRNFKQSQASKDQLKKSLKYALGENTRGGSLEDKSNKSRPSFNYDDLPRKSPLYISKNRSILKTGSHGLEGVNNQEISCPSAEDLLSKCPDHKNALVLSAGSGDSEDKIALNCNVSVTEAEGLKRIRVQKFIEDSSKDTVISTTEGSVPKVEIPQKDQQKACEQWMSDSCVEGNGCQYLHSWFHGVGFSMLAKLSGHIEAVSGIALPSGSDKLYSGSTDGTVRVWDCCTGQSVRVMNLGDVIGSLISVGSWVFVGMPNVVKAWNIQTEADFSLYELVGQIYTMTAARDMLFAGAQNGVILAWKGSTESKNPFQLATSLEGHTGAVTCLAVGAKWLYSGSADSTIRVWDLDTLQCIYTLNGHADAVMSLICWNQHLLSCSLDQTVKVWFATDESRFEVIYTHEEYHGALVLCGVNDAATKPVLLCSCNDKSVRLYELPSFRERGRIFSKQVVRTIQAGPDGLFFTGDGTGLLNVWKWAEQRVAS